ncbi:MAG TPA: hypothetical protein VMW77_06485 [Methanoregula sp.]|nr:hypothetical protein [Methanoregula sp.]
MKQFAIRIVCCISIILLVVATGCIAPPQENATASKTGSTAGGNQLIPGTTETPSYVTDVTPFVTSTPTGVYRTIVSATPVPQDIYCRIYAITNTFAYNKTAVSFNLQYPPMYINYTVKPTNVTYWDYIDTKITGEKEKRVKVDKYSPDSWFEVTVRSKLNPDEIYLKEGFGTAKGYNTYLNNTLKILNRDDMQIEFYGNGITATASVWVKPEGNFDDTTQFNMTTDCAYFASNPRNVVYIATTKATATPTYRAQ